MMPLKRCTARLPGCQRKFQEELCSFFFLSDLFDRVPNHTRFPAFKKPPHALLVGLVEPFRHEERQRSALHLMGGIAEDPFRCRIEVDDVTLVVG